MKKETVIFRWLLVVLLSVSLVWGAAAVWRLWFLIPCRVEADCRGRETSVEDIRQWEEQDDQGALGLFRLDGWRIDREQQVFSVNTGRHQSARIISVYGSMELAGQGELLCGRYGLPLEGDFCVVTEALARELLGSTWILGEPLQLGGRRMTVAGVIRSQERILLMPMEEGVIQQLAVELKGCGRARERVERMMGE